MPVRGSHPTIIFKRLGAVWFIAYGNKRDPADLSKSFLPKWKRRSWLKDNYIGS